VNTQAFLPGQNLPFFLKTATFGILQTILIVLVTAPRGWGQIHLKLFPAKELSACNLCDQKAG
jgi:hypothetical protein